MQESKFILKSKYQPAGDQGSAIEALTRYIRDGHKWQTLWGVTGSGKTFTMANVIEKIQKPTLIVAHNKTLAAQLAQEFKEFFPDAAVHYFVSYYDYYQPEAYVKKTDTYIEKEATINEEIDRLRHAATQSLMTRKDVIIVASVSCIYGIGDISAYTEQIFQLKKGWAYILEELLKNLVNIQFTRAKADFKPGNFIVQGDILEIWPASSEYCYVIEFWGDEITQITTRHPLSNEILEYHDVIEIFPAKHTVSSKDTINAIIPAIQEELTERLAYFESMGDVLKHERLKAKVEYDIEMLQEVGYVNGIENYSRFLDWRQPGMPPATLIDYFGDDFLTFIDESHMTIPQIGGMYAGDRSRKENLVENGFRLPSAMDNRPLKFPEFEAKLKQVVAVSATPGSYEIERSCENCYDSSLQNNAILNNLTQDTSIQLSPTRGKSELQNSVASSLLQERVERGVVGEGENGHTKAERFFNFDPTAGELWRDSDKSRIVSQMIRPTGLLDPEIEILAMQYMVDDIMETIDFCVGRNERMLITTLTKRSSEELTEYLREHNIKVQYLHSEVDTLERLEILKSLREGKIDVIVGVNLLREGLDLPEVSRISILDADKQGFLRSEQALIQIIGRAARNQHGKVKMYVEKHKTLPDELVPVANLFDTELYFFNNGKYITKDGYIISSSMKKAMDLTYYRRGIQIEHNKKNNIQASTVISSIKDIGIPSKKEKLKLRDGVSVEQEIKRLELEMDIAAANMEYEKAADLRDTIIELKAGKKKKIRG